MSKYTFTFKKDNIFVEFITEDRDVIERQFQIWVAAADDYAKNGVKSIKGKTINSLTEEENKPSKTEEKIVEPKPEVETTQEQEKPKEETESAPIKIEAEVTEPSQQQESRPSEVVDKASNLLRTINTIQNEDEQKTMELQENLEEQMEAFSSVLEEKIENPTFEPTKTQDAIFMNLVNSKQTTDKFHYLIITAYYLSEFEKLEKFSLKQINSKLMQNLSEVIDHAMLQDAINQNFIEVIPDLTGIADVAEYRITRAGEEFFANQIG